MKSRLLSVAALLIVVGTASAATKQKWTPGWDNFSAPLNLKTSSVTWSVNDTTKKLTLTFTLVGAAPTSLFQLSLNFFCTTFPATFGQFPNDTPGGGSCESATRQGVTETIAEVEVGAILTDINGDGSLTVVIGPVASGTYDLEFFVRNGAGCEVSGGGGNGVSICEADFQSPGPTFGDATTITVP